jgi:hypothetical protein
MAVYQENTGSPHPLSGGIQSSRKRGSPLPLTDDGAQQALWYGAITVGTPPVTFTGTVFLSAVSKSAI